MLQHYVERQGNEKKNVLKLEYLELGKWLKNSLSFENSYQKYRST